MQREITADVDLVTPDGRLNPDAVGWSRRPRHLARFRSPDLRSKRWEWWGVVTPRHIVGVTVADARYVGLATIHVLDRRTGGQTTHDATIPFARGVELGEWCGSGTSRAGTSSFRVETHVDASTSETLIRAGGRAISESGGPILFETHVGGEERDSLGVVVPWNERRFQYTVKDVGRPARGRLVINGQAHTFGGDGSFAVADHGRGIWPYRMRWNWAAAAAMDGRDLALTLGGTWTDGTGATEDGLFVDGVLHKHHSPLRWTYDRTDWLAPWTIRGPHVDVVFHPDHLRRAHTNALLVRTTTHQAFGTFTGWVADSAGERHVVDGLVGWAEEADNRW